MLSWTIQHYLETKHVPYERIEHIYSATASQTARLSHISGKRLAKTVIVNVDGELMMVVLLADELIHWERLKESLGAEYIRLATEAEFEDRFPDCDTGAMPPLGDLYGMPVVVSEGVASAEKITFNAGTHTDLIAMPYESFRKIVHPLVGRFTSH